MQKLGWSIARQTTKLANGSIPYHESHAQFMNGVWLGGRNLFALLLSGSLHPPLAKIVNFFQAATQSSGAKKNCIVYNFFCIFIIIIVIIITIIYINSCISISFVV